VRFRLEEPVVVRWGDRLVIRAYSPATTIGGAVVADPWPAPRPRRPADVGDLLRPPGERVVAAARRAGPRGLPLDHLPVRLGIPPGNADETLRAAREGTVIVGRRLVTRETVAGVTARVRAALADYHGAHRLEPGMPMERLRRIDPDSEVVEAGLAGLVGEGTAVLEGNLARLAAHTVTLSADDAIVMESVRNVLRTAGFEGLTLEELAGATRGADLEPVVDYLVSVAQVVCVGGDRFLDADIIQEVVGHARRELGETGGLGPAQMRARLGLTRKYSIPLLEWLDGQGYTVRQGDIRVAGPRLTEGLADS
jgi:selenocysteine-specific elongation factor